jgi:hypothetical protein
MTLYATTFSLGLPGVEPEYVELTPEVIRDFLNTAVAFEKIGFSPQVIADLVVKRPTVDDRIKALKKKYYLTDRQGLLVQTLPLREAPLYFDKHEYTNQVERLKTLQRLLQEMQDVLDK